MLAYFYSGVLAQLGEHNAGSVEVRGSNPLHSTIITLILFFYGSNSFSC